MRQVHLNIRRDCIDKDDTLAMDKQRNVKFSMLNSYTTVIPNGQLSMYASLCSYLEIAHCILSVQK